MGYRFNAKCQIIYRWCRNVFWLLIFESPAVQEETASLKSMRRAVLISSRELRGSVELFVASIAEWEGDVVRLVLAA
jgi:hypothetical protein